MTYWKLAPVLFSSKTAPNLVDPLDCKLFSITGPDKHSNLYDIDLFQLPT